ncbi:hypothetical protein [Streptomyces sp. NPDC026589]|uniref:hypothetical protein n=1 Tax=Streptomyces sp. NPDC026589 TaxID=3155609 RepID=UPI0033EBC108
MNVPHPSAEHQLQSFVDTTLLALACTGDAVIATTPTAAPVPTNTRVNFRKIASCLVELASDHHRDMQKPSTEIYRQPADSSQWAI